MRAPPPLSLSRRQVVIGLGGAAALVGCTPKGATPAGDSPEDSARESTPPDSPADSEAPVEGWAVGGTALMAGKDYGDPFEAGLGEVCAVYVPTAVGPCHATSDALLRPDVSDGRIGLPMRLELLIVDEACAPVPGAVVEIWMAGTLGNYSGDIDGSNDDFCTGGNAEAAASLWGRGIQVADAAGRVRFDGLFPGWYIGRTTHIHVRVLLGEVESLVSQVLFDDALKEEIYASHPEYVPGGVPGYITNEADQIIREARLELAAALVSVERQRDGAMLAWKALAIQRA